VPQLSGFTGSSTSRSSDRLHGHHNTLNIDLPTSISTWRRRATDPADRAREVRHAARDSGGDDGAGDVILEANAGQVFSSSRRTSRRLQLHRATTLRVTRSPTGKIDMTITGKLAASL
jgi:hypothetical protein